MAFHLHPRHAPNVSHEGRACESVQVRQLPFHGVVVRSHAAGSPDFDVNLLWRCADLSLKLMMHPPGLDLPLIHFV